MMVAMSLLPSHWSGRPLWAEIDLDALTSNVRLLALACGSGSPTFILATSRPFSAGMANSAWTPTSWRTSPTPWEFLAGVSARLPRLYLRNGRVEAVTTLNTRAPAPPMDRSA